MSDPTQSVEGGITPETPPDRMVAPPPEGPIDYRPKAARMATEMMCSGHISASDAAACWTSLAEAVCKFLKDGDLTSQSR